MPDHSQRAHPIERREGEIGQNQIHPATFKSEIKFFAPRHHLDLAIEALGRKRHEHQFGIHRVVFQMQYAKALRHFAPPRCCTGGGSLMIAQKAPISLTALMNSVKLTGLTT